jgi:hypothetical protein
MITYIETKESTTFHDFFYNRKKYTEFFLYFAWICFQSNKDYVYVDEYIDNIIIGPADPNIYHWNTWEHKKYYLDKKRPSVFSLSSKCVKFIDDTYKAEIMNFYNEMYNDSVVNDLLKQILK